MATHREQIIRLGIIFAATSLVLVFIAFASPYWYKSWTRVYSPFANIGLWHACLSSYVRPSDPMQLAFVGCWWIHSTVFEHVWDNLMPPWFRGIQALVVFTLLCDLVALILSILIYHRHKWVSGKRRPKIILLISILMMAAAFFIFLVSLIFPTMANQGGWLPRPWMSYLSWSYGLNCLGGFSNAFGGIAFYILFVLVKDRQDEIEEKKETKFIPPASHPLQEKVAPIMMERFAREQQIDTTGRLGYRGPGSVDGSQTHRMAPIHYMGGGSHGGGSQFGGSNMSRDMAGVQKAESHV